jgi:hypothetical protein
MPAPNTQLVKTLHDAGFRGNALRTAYGIAMRESGGRPDAYNGNTGTGDQSYGMFQINMLGSMGPARRRQFGLKKNEDLFDAVTNARAAFQMSKGGKDFGAWGIGPNAYREGAGWDTISKYVGEFPGPPKSQVPKTNPFAGQAKVQPGNQTYGGGGRTAPQLATDSGASGMFQQALGGFFLGRAAARREGRDPQGGLMELAQLRHQYQVMGGVPDRAPDRGAPGSRVAPQNTHPRQRKLAGLKAGKTSASLLGKKGALVPGVNFAETPHAGGTSGGLGWGNSNPADMMARAGTPVGSPIDGVVQYFHPTGAQGGGSMLIRADNGREYWLGHIDGGIPGGTRVRRGDQVARVSADHPAPHLHIDWRKR